MPVPRRTAALTPCVVSKITKIRRTGHASIIYCAISAYEVKIPVQKSLKMLKKATWRHAMLRARPIEVLK